MNQDLGTIIRQVILSEDDTEKNLFISVFDDEIKQFAFLMTAAFSRWEDFNSKIGENENKLKISELIYCCINHSIVAMELFLTGNLVPSGNIMRQALEALAMGILASKPNLGFLYKFSNDKYSTSNAIRDVLRNSKVLNIKKDAMKTIQKSETFYHKFSHITLMTIALNSSFSDPKTKPLGGYFDKGKIKQYKKEMDGRIELAKILPNLIQGIENNLNE
jgi:hypothetical protein